MAKRKIEFVNGEIYHIVIKAIEGFKLFRDKKDFLRMMHDLFEFNDSNPTSSFFRTNQYRNKSSKVKSNMTKSDLVTLTNALETQKRKKRKIIVEILEFCLMPNHVHLLVRQIKKNGISKFMQKICGGYTLYYNKKYKRRGHLFQSRFQAIHIKNNNQLETIFVYIHTNPVAFIYPNWKEKGIKDLKKAINFIEEYGWSSYPDYLGRKNFPSITSRDFMLKVMGGPQGCRGAVNSWLRYKKELTDLDYLAID